MTDLDKEFWLTVRAALIMFVRAIEKRYGLNRHEFTDETPVTVGYNVSEVKG